MVVFVYVELFLMQRKLGHSTTVADKPVHKGRRNSLEISFSTTLTAYLRTVEVRTANKGPVRIQYKCLVPIYVLSEMKLLFPKQNYM